MNQFKEVQLQWKSVWLLLIMAIIILILLPGSAGAAAAKSATFQYSSDVTLEASNYNRNYGSSTKCYVDGTYGGGGERSTLLSWNISSLPKNSTITKATLFLRVDDPSRDTFNVYGLRKKWIESEATWQRASNKLFWTSAGASSSSDRDTYSSGTLYARKAGTAKIELDRDLVAGWLRRPQANYGMIIASARRTSGDRIGFYCSEATQSTQRPKLVVEYR